MQDVVLLSNIYPSEQTPYNGVYVQNMERALIAQGVNVKKSVVAGRHKSYGLKLWLYLRYFFGSLWLMSIGRPTVFVHYVGHTSIPVLLMLLFKKLTVVAHVHGTDIVPNKSEAPWFSRLKLKVCRAILTRSTTVLVPSTHFKNLVHQRFGVPVDNIVINPAGGVDTQKFHPRLRTQHNFNPQSRVQLGFVSRLDAGKGVETLLQAMCLVLKKHPTLHCDFIGDGDKADEYRRLASSLGLTQHCTFHGALPQDKLAQNYARFDYFIFPSELEESLGLVGLEALATGTPVIGSNHAGLLDYLDEGNNGFTFTPGDIEHLVKVINTALAVDEHAYEGLCIAARQSALPFDAEQVNARLLAVFR